MSTKQTLINAVNNDDMETFKQKATSNYVDSASGHITDILVEAVRNNCTDAIKHLAKWDAPLSGQNGKPLHVSVHEAEPQTTRCLIEHEPLIYKYKDVYDHPLVEAIKLGKPSHVKVFESKTPMAVGTNRNGEKQHKNKWSSLAPITDNDVGRALIEALGAIQGDKTPEGYLAYRFRAGDVQTFETLIDAGFKPGDYSVLYRGVDGTDLEETDNHVKIVKMLACPNNVSSGLVRALLRAGLFESACYLIKNNDQFTDLLVGQVWRTVIAYYKPGHKDILNIFQQSSVDTLSIHSSDPSATSITSLTYALQHKAHEVYEWLFNQYDNLSDDRTSIAAVIMEYVDKQNFKQGRELIKKLVKRKAGFDIDRADESVWDILHKNYNQLGDVFALLVEQYSNISSMFVRTAIAKHRTDVVVDVFEQYTPNFDDINDLLYKAVLNGQSNLAQMLVEYGAEPHKAVVKTLKKARVDTQTNRQNRRLQTNTSLLLHGFDNIFKIDWDDHAQKMLKTAAKHANDPSVLTTLDHLGAKISDYARPALLVANKAGRKDFVNTLIDYGASEAALAAHTV